MRRGLPATAARPNAALPGPTRPYPALPGPTAPSPALPHPTRPCPALADISSDLLRCDFLLLASYNPVHWQFPSPEAPEERENSANIMKTTRECESSRMEALLPAPSANGRPVRAISGSGHSPVVCCEYHRNKWTTLQNSYLTIEGNFLRISLEYSNQSNKRHFSFD